MSGHCSGNGGSPRACRRIRLPHSARAATCKRRRRIGQKETRARFRVTRRSGHAASESLKQSFARVSTLKCPCKFPRPRTSLVSHYVTLHWGRHLILFLTIPRLEALVHGDGLRRDPYLVKSVIHSSQLLSAFGTSG